MVQPGLAKNSRPATCGQRRCFSVSPRKASAACPGLKRHPSPATTDSAPGRGGTCLEAGAGCQNPARGHRKTPSTPTNDREFFWESGPGHQRACSYEASLKSHLSIIVNHLPTSRPTLRNYNILIGNFNYLHPSGDGQRFLGEQFFTPWYAYMVFWPPVRGGEFFMIHFSKKILKSPFFISRGFRSHFIIQFQNEYKREDQGFFSHRQTMKVPLKK